MPWEAKGPTVPTPVLVHPTDLRSLIDASPDAIVVADARGQVRFVNPVAVELLGGSLSELIGTPFPLSPDDHHGHLERPDGIAVDLEVRWTQVMWEGNAAWAAFINQKVSGGTTYDVELERRATQAELRCDQLQEQLQQEQPLKEKVSALEKALQDKEEEFQELFKQHNFLQHRIQQAEHRAKETEEAALDGWATAEERAKGAEIRLRDMEAELAEVKARLEEREKMSPADLEDQARQAERKLTEQLGRIAALEDELARLQDKAPPKESTAWEELHAQVTAARQVAADAEEKVASLEQRLYTQEQRTLQAEERAESYSMRLAATQQAAQELEHGLQQRLAELAARDQETQRLAYEDRLTGLANFNLFQQYLEYTADMVARQEGAAILAVLDLERLRAINQTMSVAAGDEVLAQVAERLKALIRPTDVMGRRRDDEFLIVVAVKSTEIVEARGTVAQISQSLAQKIMTVMEEPLTIDGTPLPIYVSMGLTFFGPPAENWQQTLEQAYIALDKAKELGRNRFHFFGNDLLDKVRRRGHMVSRLREALDRQEFLMHYQPVVDLRSGKVVGMEALLRWNDPHGGLLEPTEFLPAAEESSLIIPIGEWAVQEACLMAAQHGSLFMSVNVSARQLMHGEFPRRFMKAVERARIRPEKMIVEVSEGTMNLDPERVCAVLAELARWKVGIAIDDFGTSATALNRLHQEQLRFIKVDSGLVGQLPDDRQALKLVLAATHLAASLQVQALAEGVENGEQLMLLRKMGCHLAQGRYLSPPVPAGGAREAVRKTWKF